MNGNGKPVGGSEPLNISYCLINFDNKKELFIALFLFLHSFEELHSFQIEF